MHEESVHEMGEARETSACESQATPRKRLLGPWMEGGMSWEEFCELGRRSVHERAVLSAERRAALEGQVVAWEPDGSGIRAHGPDLENVWDQIEAQGDDPSLFVYERIIPI